MSKEPIPISKAEAIDKLWRMGNLEWKLRGKQKLMKKALSDNITDKVHTVLASRRMGKSYVLCCWAIEICLKTPRAIIKFATPVKEQAEEIITDIIPNFILNDCPKDLLPEWKEQKKMYLFPNGSKLKIAGANKDKGNSLKGGRAHLCIVDEAQDHNYLSHLVNNVLTPTTDTTGGNVVLCGTPNSREPEHPFHTDYILPLAAEGKLIKFTVYDTWRYEQEGQAFIDELANRYRHKGGLNSAEFKCEYNCEIAFNRDVMVLPEFDQNLQDKIVKVVERPAYFDSYVGMDIGVRDLTGILFCYYDYINSKLIIEDEEIINGNELTTDKVKALVVNKEKLLWHDMMGNPIKPYLRIADNNNLILINDLQILHGIQFITTRKDDKDAQINQLRMYLDSEKIIINPKCRNLIYQMRNVKWKGNKKEFMRINDSSSGELKGGHADLVDALIYIVRNVIWTKNPYPPGFFDQRSEGIFQSMFGISGETKLKDAMCKIFNIKPHK